MKAVILAAGKGVRLRPLTDQIPKCMAAVKDKPMLEHILDRLIKAGVDEAHLVVGYKKEIIEDHFGPEYAGIKLNYFVQKEQKGTAHAVSLVEKYIDDKFIIANSDVITGTGNYKMLATTDEFEQVDGLILARKVKDPWRFGVLKTNETEVVGIVEKPDPGNEPSNLVSMGIYRFRKDFFESIKNTPLSPRNEYELVDSIKDYIVRNKKVEYRLSTGSCADIGNMDDLQRANEMLDEIFPK
ncbi:MAG: sugar phosphate nucleotidyltransferase [archaeon]|nr:sugar phosphate nucleotidyltransferase [archaeon]